MNGSLEDRAYTGGLLIIGALAAVASFRHVADAAIRFGQSSPGWLPYALAGTPDLLAVIAGLSIRRRHQVGASTRGPVALLVMSVVVLVAAQLVTAQRSFGGWFAAAWPAIAFLSVVALVETEPGRHTEPPAVAEPVRERAPEPVTVDPAPAPVSVESGPVTVPVVVTVEPEPAKVAPTRRPSSVGDLLLVGQAVAADLAAQGQPLTRRNLVDGLRARGHSVGTERARDLLAALRAA